LFLITSRGFRWTRNESDARRFWNPYEGAGSYPEYGDNGRSRKFNIKKATMSVYIEMILGRLISVRNMKSKIRAIFSLVALRALLCQEPWPYNDIVYADSLASRRAFESEYV